MFFRSMLTTALLLAAFVAPASAQMDHSKMHHENPAAHTEAGKAFDAAMAKIHKDMVVKQTGNTDADFLIGMIPHHQGAIDMAKAELVYGTDPVMRRMAQEILVDQRSEIDAMRLWLGKTTAGYPQKEK